MKRFFPPSLWRGGATGLLALAALLGGTAAHAGGTTAGTSIDNKATLTYSVGTVNQNSIGSSPTGNTSGSGLNTSFVVDKKINLTVTTSDSAAVSAIPGQTAVTTTFVVTNTGNSVQDYDLTLSNLSSGTQSVFSSNLTDNFDVSSCSVQVNGTAQSYIANLAIDGSQTVKVVCPIANTQVNNDIAAVYLLAEAKVAGTNGATALTQSTTNDPTVVDTVFADTAGLDDSSRDAKASARSAYKVVTATLSVQKTFSSVCDPLNGSTNATNIPGGYVQYIVAITNNGSASASLTEVSDTLVSSVTFDPDFITGSGAGSNCAATGSGGTATSANGKGFKIVNSARTTAGFSYPKYLTGSNADSDGGVISSGTITINFATAMPAETGYTAGELKVGETVQVVYQVKIN
jgi:uncharacterized repeat protein (TIGR01451 family)